MPERRSTIGKATRAKTDPQARPAPVDLDTRFKLTVDLTTDQRRQLTAYLARKATELDRARVPIGKAIVAMMTAAFTDDHTDQIVTDLLR